MVGMHTVPRGLFVGLATVDVICRVEHHPAPNEKVVASERSLCAGGPATNAAVAFAHAGGSPLLVSAAGTSPLSAIIRSDLAECGVEFHDIAGSADFVPAVATVMVDAGTGLRAVVLTKWGPLPAVSLPEPAILDGVSVLLLDGHVLPVALPLARAARERGVPVVLDGGSWKPALEELLPFVDFAICSGDFHLPGRPDDSVLSGLISGGARFAAVSHGGEPIEWMNSRGQGGAIDVAGAAPVDTLGAGDVLHGVFCCFLARGGDPVQALTQAARVATHACGYFGTREWLRHPCAALED